MFHALFLTGLSLMWCLQGTFPLKCEHLCFCAEPTSPWHTLIVQMEKYQPGVLGAGSGSTCTNCQLRAFREAG